LIPNGSFFQPTVHTGFEQSINVFNMSCTIFFNENIKFNH